MTTRTAEEAELSDPSTCPEHTRPRTDDPSNGRTSLSDSKQGDALDALTYIRAPSRDPLEIHGWDQSTTMENLSRAQGDMWMNEEGAKILAYRAYGGKINDIDDLAKLRNDIKSTLGINTNPIVAVPIPEIGKTKKDTPPFCTLVKGITPEQARELVTRVRPNHPPPPHWENSHQLRSSDSSPQRSPRLSSSRSRPRPPRSRPPSGVLSSLTRLTNKLRMKS